jgi:hypothetical protein
MNESRTDRATVIAGTLMIASMLTLMRSFLPVKLCFVALFLFTSVWTGFFKTRVVLYDRLIWFYAYVSFVAAIWALIGVFHPGNFVQGNLDAFKLYVVWSGAFLVLYTLLRSIHSLTVMHHGFVLAGILVPLINLIGLRDDLSGSSVLPTFVRGQLNLEIGFERGYYQFDSANLISMFLVAPYLLALQFRADATDKRPVLTRLALALSLILVILSGRRALWLVVALTPITILVLTAITRSFGSVKPSQKRLLALSTGIVIGGLFLLFAFSEGGGDIGVVAHTQQGFSGDDERTIQAPFLIRAFARSPIVGSGFGAYAGYQRSDAHPWEYELTYHKLLFNLGILGTTLLLGLFSAYVIFATKLFRRFKENSAVPFGLFVAFCSLLAGSYSNPYLNGFDSLFFVGLLPYLATFQNGFDRVRPFVRTPIGQHHLPGYAERL